MNQYTKKSLLDFIKANKKSTELFAVNSFNGFNNYWLYNGVLMSTKVFNIRYALIHCKVKPAQISSEDIYTIKPVPKDQLKIFGL